MSKDPREGLKLRLGYEVAREIERTPIISLGVQDAATKAINSVLYQRLQDQIIVDNPTLRINEERIRHINVTAIASENNINKADLIAVLQSGGFQGPLAVGSSPLAFLRCSNGRVLITGSSQRQIVGTTSLPSILQWVLSNRH